MFESFLLINFVKIYLYLFTLIGSLNDYIVCIFTT
jgi:hypothetical protein